MLAVVLSYLAHRILSNEQNHGFGINIHIIQTGRKELSKVVRLFQGAYVLFVHLSVGEYCITIALRFYYEPP